MPSTKRPPARTLVGGRGALQGWKLVWAAMSVFQMIAGVR